MDAWLFRLIFLAFNDPTKQGPFLCVWLAYDGSLLVGNILSTHKIESEPDK